jgi:hypothetical protein
MHLQPPYDSTTWSTPASAASKVHAQSAEAAAAAAAAAVSTPTAPSEISSNNIINDNRHHLTRCAAEAATSNAGVGRRRNIWCKAVVKKARCVKAHGVNATKRLQLATIQETPQRPLPDHPHSTLGLSPNQSLPSPGRAFSPHFSSPAAPLKLDNQHSAAAPVGYRIHSHVHQNAYVMSSPALLKGKAPDARVVKEGGKVLQLPPLSMLIHAPTTAIGGAHQCCTGSHPGIRPPQQLHIHAPT